VTDSRPPSRDCRSVLICQLDIGARDASSLRCLVSSRFLTTSAESFQLETTTEPQASYRPARVPGCHRPGPRSS
jgi:hypothetical protein